MVNTNYINPLLSWTNKIKARLIISFSFLFHLILFNTDIVTIIAHAYLKYLVIDIDINININIYIDIDIDNFLWLIKLY